MFGQCQPERHNLFVAGETGHWKVTSMIDEITVHLATQVCSAENRYAQSQVLAGLPEAALWTRDTEVSCRCFGPI